MRISDFNIIKTFFSTNGECYIAELDGHKYFVKRNIDICYDPNYESKDAYTKQLEEAKKKKTQSWLAYHKDIIKRYMSDGSNGTGNIAFPIEYWIEDGKVYECSHHIDIIKLPINDDDVEEARKKLAEGKEAITTKVSELPFEDKLLILKTATMSIKLIHDHGIIHFDLKPDNIPFSKSETGKFIAKITDCGDAIFEDRILPEDEIVCTEPYWSPELAKYKLGNKDVKSLLSCKSDVFALGLIFSEWLTGDFPEYQGKEDFMCPYQVVTKLWANGGIKVSEELPQWLRALILDMLCPVPDMRPAIADVMAALTKQEYESKFKSKLDYTAFKDALKSASFDEDAESEYTKESIDKVKSFAKSLVERAKAATTQEEVDKCTAFALTLPGYFEKKAVLNFDSFNERVKSARSLLDSKREQYTEESIATLEGCLADVTAATFTAQEEIDAAEQTLVRALGALKKKESVPVPKTETKPVTPRTQTEFYLMLKAKIAQLRSGMNSIYTPQSLERFNRIVEFIEAEQCNITTRDELMEVGKALAMAHALLEKQGHTDPVSTDDPPPRKPASRFGLTVCSPLPAGYSNVNIISSEKITVTYKGVQMPLGVDTAIRYGIVKRV